MGARAPTRSGGGAREKPRRFDGGAAERASLDSSDVTAAVWATTASVKDSWRDRSASRLLWGTSLCRARLSARLSDPRIAYRSVRYGCGKKFQNYNLLILTIFDLSLVALSFPVHSRFALCPLSSLRFASPVVHCRVLPVANGVTVFGAATWRT